MARVETIGVRAVSNTCCSHAKDPKPIIIWVDDGMKEWKEQFISEEPAGSIKHVSRENEMEIMLFLNRTTSRLIRNNSLQI